MQSADQKIGQIKIKPPLSSLDSKNNKDVAALRAELELELKNKKQCAYQPYECTQLTLDGYKYCLKHILQDKNAPFKQCSFVYSNNGKRCQLAAPKVEKKEFGYCNEHAVKTTLIKNRQNSRFPPPQTAEVLLYSLAHYVRKPRNRNVSSSADEAERNTDSDSLEQKATKGLDPLKEIDAATVTSSSCNNILDLCSESDSDVDAATFSTIWHDAQNDSSDAESIDSEQEDYLKHANIFTAEEISSIAKDKLLKLQSLYIEQYRHLQHVFREKKRKYYHSLKREKETCCNIHTQIRENPKEQRLYKKLKAYNKYHKTYGVEAILNKRLHDSRAKITDGLPTSKPNPFTKCMFSEGGVKCGERTLPLAKHCRKHILEDNNQVLFKACGKIKLADIECSTPVEAIFEEACCRLHQDIPTIRSYNQVRKNSESDFDESYENVDNLLTDQSSMDNSMIATKSLVSASTSVFTGDSELIDYKPDIEEMKTLPSVLFEESSSEYFDSKFSKALKQEQNESSGNDELMQEPEPQQEISTSSTLTADENEDSINHEIQVEVVEPNTSTTVTSR